MATLPTEDRVKVFAGLLRYWSNLREPTPLSKAEFQAAVDATDSWIDANQAAFNAALPLAARNNLTINQKTLLFCAVAMARVSLDFARRIFQL
jgi:hypothetical protein